MTLIKCPDCATEVSSEAIACPKCGRCFWGSYAVAFPLRILFFGLWWFLAGFGKDAWRFLGFAGSAGAALWLTFSWLKFQYRGNPRPILAWIKMEPLNDAAPSRKPPEGFISWVIMRAVALGVLVLFLLVTLIVFLWTLLMLSWHLLVLALRGVLKF
jgi:hypothetical protein